MLDRFLSQKDPLLPQQVDYCWDGIAQHALADQLSRILCLSPTDNLLCQAAVVVNRTSKTARQKARSRESHVIVVTVRRRRVDQTGTRICSDVRRNKDRGQCRRL